MDYFSIFIKLRKVIRFINLENKRIEKKVGLSIPQLLTLQLLSQCVGRRATGKEIKKHLVLNASTVTGIVNRLEKKGLVVKANSPDDRRTTFIVLTAPGMEALRQSPTTAQVNLSDKLTSLSPEKLAELSKSIDLLINILGAEEVDASAILMTGEISQLSTCEGAVSSKQTPEF